MVENLPANARDVREAGSTLGGEDPLEEGMATHSSILAWRIPWTGAWRATGLLWCCKESDTTEATQHSTQCRENRTLKEGSFPTTALGTRFIK